MKYQWRGMAALVACLGLLFTQSADAQRQREYQTANDAAERASVSLASYNSYDATCGCSDYGSGSCGSGSCDSGGCGYDGGGCDGGGSCGCGGGTCGGGRGLGLGLGGGLLSRPGQFFAGAEYIYARANFSEALAYVVTDLNAGLNAGPNFVEFDFESESSYRFYGGYRFCDCGGEIVFNHARYRSGASFDVVEGVGMDIKSPYEVDAPGTGTNGRLSGLADVEINTYDISFAKTLALGTLGCATDCGDACCGVGCGDGCGSCACPAWDITWSAGLRFDEVEWARGTLGTDNAGDQIDSATTRLNFEGAGARVGLLGRRYIGRRGLLSVYGKGDITLLVGDMDIRTTTIQDPDGTAPFTALSHRNSARRVIPVTEIEAGLTAHLGNHIQLSSGYFISAWHDLGMRDEYDFENPAAAGGGAQYQLSHYDDANILGFDGFFARAEVSY